MNTVTASPIHLALMSDVEGLKARIANAVDDDATFKRLSQARANAAQLTKELASAQDALTAYAIAETRAEMDSMFSKFGDMAVTVTTEAGETANPIRSRYAITYEQRAYNTNTRRSDMVQRTTNGFAMLDTEAMAYLIERKPEAIPALIMDLAPGNPEAAFDQYFMAMRRGYLTGTVAA